MSCPECEIDYVAVAKVAYGPMPEDGVLLTGLQMQRFARRVIEDALKPFALVSGESEWDATP